MNMAGLAQQIRGDKPKVKPKRQYTKQSDLVKDVGRAVREPLTNISRMLWGYSGHAGLLVPWHDTPDTAYIFFYKQVYGFVEYLQKEDISLKAYAAFIFPIMHYTKYERVSLLLAGTGERSWMKKLRIHAGSREMLDEAADAFFQFIQIQVEINGKADILRNRIVEKDHVRGGKYCAAYHLFVDRVKQCKDAGIDPVVWVKAKARNHIRCYPGEKLHFRALVNVNGLDPKREELQQQTKDEWRVIRDFLGVSPECEFIDGTIPKGWGLASDDREDLTKIVRIDKDGYYWYANGEQHRGKRHYMQNAYWVIACNPDNFDLFRSTWLDVRLMSKAPTWDEYARWAVYPELWDQAGAAVNGRGKPVHWRRS